MKTFIDKNQEMYFVQDAQKTMRCVKDKYGFERWSVAKPEGITFMKRVRMAIAVLKGRAFACHWH